ncbi:YraN family protein [Tropicimonas marinistellae]|uniref:YraN family protein n=1 Tax=Tropicimonas marinistellae TaxID=1739787 RepID=UPI00082E176C|nr:YraN family protein [Tropicimonas marinistellae]
MSGSVSYHAGLAAEQIVARHYERSGKPIAEWRWRGQGGEIDLIVRDGEGLIFVEVKKAEDFARAVQRVSPRQVGRIVAAAAEYLGQMPKGELTDVRFDVAMVNGRGELQVVENAFGP